MNCFDWQNRVSDYLDGSLMPAIKSEADEHLEHCKACNDRFKHYRMIVSSLASQPRSALPVPIRKSPLAMPLPRLDVGRLSRSRWEQIPWYLRTSIESVAIIMTILLGISAGPKIRSFYESRIERSLDEFNKSFDEVEKPDVGPAAAIPLARAKATSASDTANSADTDTDDFAGGDSDGPVNTGAKETSSATDKIHVGGQEIWRFILKTDSPHDVRPRVVKLLLDLKIPADTPGLGGIEAPGGIQFDLLVPEKVVLNIKRQLQAMAPKPPVELLQTPAGETFTWYKNSSKKRLPPYKTRVVIWLSQM